jgi:hypothetical protein
MVIFTYWGERSLHIVVVLKADDRLATKYQTVLSRDQNNLGLRKNILKQLFRGLHHSEKMIAEKSRICKNKAKLVNLKDVNTENQK